MCERVGEQDEINALLVREFVVRLKGGDRFVFGGAAKKRGRSPNTKIQHSRSCLVGGGLLRQRLR